MFQLKPEETENLRPQFVTSSWGGRRYLPYAFTAQGVAMLSSVLKSGPAIRVNIAIMRTFVKLREILSTHKELAQKIHDLEQKFQKHDSDFQAAFEAIRGLLAEREEESSKRRIGFPDQSA